MHTIFSGLARSHRMSRRITALAVHWMSDLVEDFDGWEALSNSGYVESKRVCASAEKRTWKRCDLEAAPFESLHDPAWSEVEKFPSTPPHKAHTCSRMAADKAAALAQVQLEQIPSRVLGGWLQEF